MRFDLAKIRNAALVMLAGFVLAACGQGGDAQTSDSRSQSDSGTFDFYVLALSWSPSYCATAGAKADRQQCGGQAKYSFIVHGLWPQYEKGYPDNCATDQPKSVRETLARRYEDLTPSGSLIRHEWLKHGTCSGLKQRAYFDKLRAARGRIVIPPEFHQMARERKMAPQAIEDAFVKANKGLKREDMAVTCDRRYFREVRICMTKDLDFRRCTEVDADMCRLGSVRIPAPR